MACANPTTAAHLAVLNPTELNATLEHFSDYLYARCRLRPATIENYVGALRRALPAIGFDPNERTLNHYLAEMHRRSNSSAHVTIASIALERYMASIGRPIHLGRPKNQKAAPVDPLSEVEIIVMIYLTPLLRDKAILSVLAYTGARNAELCALECRDVDIAGQLIKIREGKGGKARDAHVSGSCVRLLSEYLRERDGAPGDRLFVTLRNGNELEQQDLRKLVRRSAIRANITRRVYPHQFRHALATNMLDRGAGIYVIKEQLGHEHLVTTAVYLHSALNRRAAEYRMYAPTYL